MKLINVMLQLIVFQIVLSYKLELSDMSHVPHSISSILFVSKPKKSKIFTKNKHIGKVPLIFNKNNLPILTLFEIKTKYMIVV